jgi:tripartite-type tricarboxylate transporter receptor subunit TctC
MKLPRRQFLHLAAGATALATASRIARGQAYPTRPVRIIVGFAPGGPSDILARLMGQWLSERLSQPFIIDNRPGASSNLGTEAVVKAPPDGYALLMVSTTNTINATLYDRLSFDFRRDIAPVAAITREPHVLVVNPSVPAKSVPEFISYAKANPGKVNMASPGNGTGPHIAGELFKKMTGTEMVHVPYRGAGPAYTDLLSGQVQVMFPGPASSIGYITAGQLRVLAVTTSSRFELLPNVPTMDESLPGFEASSWFGVGAPRNTPTEIIDRLNGEINAGLASPTIKARLADLGGTPFPGTPADFGKVIAEDTEKWGKVIRTANVKPE